jgi:hypothetical protein
MRLAHAQINPTVEACFRQSTNLRIHLFYLCARRGNG